METFVDGKRGTVFPSLIVTLGLDPRVLHLLKHPQVKSPRVKPEGDERWGGSDMPTSYRGDIVDGLVCPTSWFEAPRGAPHNEVSGAWGWEEAVGGAKHWLLP